MTDNQSKQTDAKSAKNDITQSMRGKSRWLSRAVSPWVQRWLQTNVASKGRKRYQRAPTPLQRNSSQGDILRTSARLLKPVLRVNHLADDIVSRFPEPPTNKYQPRPSRMAASGQDNLVLVGVKETPSEAEQNDDWLEAMPSFEDVRRSIETAKLGGAPASPPPVPSPPPVQTQAREQSPPKPEASDTDWLERSPSFESLHRAVQAAKASRSSSQATSEPPKPIQPDSLPAVQRRVSQPKKSEPASSTEPTRRQVFSKIEEVSSGERVASQPEEPGVIQPQSEADQAVQPADQDQSTTQTDDLRESPSPSAEISSQTKDSLEHQISLPSQPTPDESVQIQTSREQASVPDTQNVTPPLQIETDAGEPTSDISPLQESGEVAPQLSDRISTPSQTLKPDLVQRKEVADPSTRQDIRVEQHSELPPEPIWDEPEPHIEQIDSSSRSDAPQSSVVQRSSYELAEPSEEISPPAPKSDEPTGDKQDMASTPVEVETKDDISPTIQKSKEPVESKQSSVSTPIEVEAKDIAQPIPDELFTPDDKVEGVQPLASGQLRQTEMEVEKVLAVKDSQSVTKPKVQRQPEPGSPPETPPASVSEIDSQMITEEASQPSESPDQVDESQAGESFVEPLPRRDSKPNVVQRSKQPSQKVDTPTTDQPVIESGTPNLNLSPPPLFIQRQRQERELSTGGDRVQLSKLSQAQRQRRMDEQKSNDTPLPLVAPKLVIPPRTQDEKSLNGGDALLREKTPLSTGVDANTTIQRQPQVQMSAAPSISATSPSDSSVIQREESLPEPQDKADEGKTGGEQPNLDQLAQQVYPLIKRMIAVERERRTFR